MHHHQHLGVVRYLAAGLRHVLHVEELAHLGDRLLLGDARHRAAGETDAVDQRDHRLAAVAELGDEAGEVVFEERLAVWREHVDGGAAGGRVGGGEAEEQLLAAGALERLDAVGDGAVLVFRERPRVDDLEHDVAVRRGGVGVEHGAHAPREGGELRRLLGEPARQEQPKPQRLVEIAEQRAGALGQGIEMLLGQVDAVAAQELRAHDVDADEDHGAEQCGDRRHAAGGEPSAPLSFAGRLGPRAGGFHGFGHCTLTPLS